MFLQDDDINKTDSGGLGSTIETTTRQLRGLERATQVTDDTFKELGKTLRSNLLDPQKIVTATAQLEQLSFRAARETMGQTSAVGEVLMKTIANATLESAQFGLTLDDHFETQKAINEVMLRNTVLTEDQSTSMGLLARNAGVAVTDIAKMVEGLRSMGMSTNTALENISGMEKQARTLGLNTSEFISRIGANIKLLTAYNFQNGVEGLSKMVAQAQSLRMDMGSVVKFADDILSPEKAIEAAAEFQMLGGAIGDLGDPFQLLHMAQTDIGGIQDQIIGMAESAVVFNEKTGDFDIPVSEMYRLREAARITGMDYQELTQTAIKSAEKTKKLSFIDDSNLGFTEEQREMLANLSEFEGGEVKFNIPGLDEIKGVGDLIDDNGKVNQERIEKLAEYQENLGKTDKQIALDQLSALDSLVENTSTLAGVVGVAQGVNTQGIMDTLEAGRVAGNEVNATFTNAFSTSNMEELGQSLTNFISSGLESPEALSKVKDAYGKIFTSIQTDLSDIGSKIDLNLDEDNILKGTKTLDLLEGAINTFALNVGNYDSSALTEYSEHLKQTTEHQKRSVQHLRQRPEPIVPDTLNLNNMNTPQPMNNGNNNGGMNLNVSGEIGLNIDGRNLPQGITNDDLVAAIRTPEVISAISNAIGNQSNSYV